MNGRLFLVRHGETEENLQRILQGHLPGVLTPKGREQMAMTANALAERGVVFSRLVASDLSRTMESAAIVAACLGIVEILPTPLLRERDWGPYTGMPISEARERYCREGVWSMPGAESEDEMAARAQRALDFLRPLCREGHVLAVTHGLFARHLVAAHFRCPFREVTPFINGEVREINLLTPTNVNISQP